MKMNKIQRYTPLFLISFLILTYSCQQMVSTQRRERIFTDVHDRKIAIADTIKRVIALGESTMRLLSYVDATTLICGIEDVEMRGVAFTHIFANPEIRQKPVIGPMSVGDAELILLQHPDVIVTSNLGEADANELQQKLSIPVVVIGYGDMGHKREELYQGISMMGQLLHRESKADSLIGYIKGEINELQRRTAHSTSTPAYLGGISYKGRHDILSTDPYYAPFEMIGLPNTARQIDSVRIPTLGNTTIDMETLIQWNPQVMFIDQGGYRLVKNNFESFSALSKLLDCYKNKQIYLVWPYYMYHSNFEIMLINAWQIGKVMYPNEFSDIDIRMKTDEILTRFVGKSVTEDLINQWGWFRNVTDEL